MESNQLLLLDNLKLHYDGNSLSGFYKKHLGTHLQI